MKYFLAALMVVSVAFGAAAKDHDYKTARVLAFQRGQMSNPVSAFGPSVPTGIASLRIGDRVVVASVWGILPVRALASMLVVGGTVQARLNGQSVEIIKPGRRHPYRLAIQKIETVEALCAQSRACGNRDAHGNTGAWQLVRVMQSNAHVPKSCKWLATIQNGTPSPTMGVALRDVRKQAAKRGATLVVIQVASPSSVKGLGSVWSIVADAYACRS